MRPTIATVAAALLLHAAPAGQQQPTPDEQRALLALEAALSFGTAAGDRVWPGYDLRAVPIALYRRGDTVLLARHPSPPDDFVRLATDLAGGAVHRGPCPPSLDANTALPFAGAVTACVDRGAFAGDRVRIGDVALILHESAHVFQATAARRGRPPWPRENAALVAGYPAGDPDNNAWGQVEGAILAAALAAADERRARELAGDFVVVRAERQAALPAPMRAFEDRLELNEGLADYFALAALRAAAESFAAPQEALRLGLRLDAFGQQEERLREALATINVAGRGAARRRFYATGAAIGLLLDRLGPADWRRRAEGGEASLHALLAEAAPAGAGRATRLAALRARHDFTGRRQREAIAAGARAAHRRAAMLAIVATAGTKLVLDLAAAAADDPVRRFDPMNLVVIGPGARVHARMVELGFGGGEARLGVPVFEDATAHRFWWVAPADVAVHSGGGAVAPGHDGAGPVRVTGADTEVTAADARCVWSEDVVWIAPGAAPDAAAPIAALRARIEAARAEAARPLPAPPFAAVDLAGVPRSHPDPGFERTVLVFASAAAWARPAHAFVRAVAGGLEPPAPNRRLLVVLSQCTEAEARAFADGLPGAIPCVHDGSRELAELFGAERYPTAVWIDADGLVAGRREGDRPEHVAEVLRLLRR